MVTSGCEAAQVRRSSPWNGREIGGFRSYLIRKRQSFFYSGALETATQASDSRRLTPQLKKPHCQFTTRFAKTAIGPRTIATSEDSMKSLAKKMQRFLTSEDGPTAVEYAVMLALIIIVCLTAIGQVGTKANTTFTNVAASMGATAS